jgi:hypothetical protein
MGYLVRATGLLLLAALVAGAPAFAGIGGFVGGTVGESEFGDYELQDEASNIVDDDTGWAVFGGYLLNPHFAVGGGYVELGQLNADGSAFGGMFTDKLEARGIEAFGMGILPLGESIQFFARLGAFTWEQDVTFTLTGTSDFMEDTSGTDLMYGAGFNWDVLGEDGFQIHLAWTQYKDVGDLQVTGHQNDIDLISVGFLYLFGK